MPRTLSETEIEDFRADLIRIATRQFAEHGVSGVTMRGLAEEAGCSRMTPYRDFKDKGDILAAVRAAAFSRLSDCTEAAASRAKGPADELEASGRAYFRFAMREPDAYRLIFEFSQDDELEYPELAKQIERHRHHMLEACEAAVSAGLIEGDPRSLSHLFWAGMHGVIALEHSGKLTLGRSFGRLSKEMVSTLFRGMAPIQKT
jgi:AcrR family transcriptional regulator